MATAAQDQLYPFSTVDGKAIPMDVMRPNGLIKTDIAANAVSSLTIPAGYAIAAIYASIDLVIDFTDLVTYPVPATALSSALFVPAMSMMTVAIPSIGPVNVIPVSAGESGFLIVQNVQKWAGISLEQQLSRR